ncbi:E3 SUMO-protein ligase NSE2-like isoform X1 [Pieris brassicae]|uniref:E3 SUMO-protein ligase NSE2-like isoform X1 n=2 Tax=Pieris brassicae TaxID=7116 RepID=UPI001E6604C2|nr:E3 SUMO-protein ligase NSE2-like isoform X1 [Pieris brassicae]
MGDSNLADLRKQCLSSLYSCTENISKYLDAERSSEYEKMKLYVKEYCLMEAQEDVAAQALEKAKGEINASNVDSLNTNFESNLRSMAKNNLTVDRHPYMLKFKKLVEKEMKSTRSNLDDSDIAITASQTTYNDPFTKKAIEDPVKNSLCGHIYEKEVIMNIIQKKKKGIKCPVAGCGNKNLIQTKHLVSDDELKFRMTLTHHSTMVQERSIMELND